MGCTENLIAESFSTEKPSKNGFYTNGNGHANGRNDSFFRVKPVCDDCGTELHAHHKDARFCNQKCADHARYHRKKTCKTWNRDDPLCLHGSFQDYSSLFESKIDVIITDPPYSRDWMPHYKDLADFALTTLHPGGWLLCLTGWAFDWEIRKIFHEAGLEYITVCTYLMSGATLTSDKRTSTGKRNYQQQAKPLLWYQKPGGPLDRRRAGTTDLIRAKESHVVVGENQVIVGENRLNRNEFHWQQCVEGFKQIAWTFANPQDVICDPCMGSGTTLVAAYLKNRKHVIGIEKEPGIFAIAEKRVAKVQEDVQAGIL